METTSPKLRLLRGRAIGDVEHTRAEGFLAEGFTTFCEYIESVSPNLCAYRLDHAGRVEYLSPSAEQILHIAPEDALGMAWEEIVAWRSESVLAGIAAEQRILHTRQALRLVHRFMTMEGDECAVQVWAAPLIDSDFVCGIAGYLQSLDDCG